MWQRSLALTLAFGLGSSASAAPPPPSAFITRAGRQLLLGGAPYRFTGLNIYNANSDGWCWYAMGQGPALDEALTAIGPGKRVIRAWFFQSLATVGGARDWAAFDHTLSVAGAHGVKVIVTLSDQWSECGDGADGASNGYKTQSWYETGYQQVDPGMLVSYRDWVAEVVTRYRDDPRVAFWQLMNEAEVQPTEGGPCPGDGSAQAQVLADWATDVAGTVKAIDQNHLVSLGTIGTGQCGANTSQYRDLHAIPQIDLCEYHDYHEPLAPIPGDQWNGLQVRLDQCAALDKPLFVGEAGIKPDEVDGTLEGRARAFAAKLGAQLDAGVAGFLAWSWSNLGSTLDNHDIGPGDPTLDVLTLAGKSGSAVHVRARRRAHRIGVAGRVVPPHPGFEVRVVLRSTRARTVIRRRATIAPSGRYATRVPRPPAGRCRVRVAFPGDEDHLGSVKVLRFRC